VSEAWLSAVAGVVVAILGLIGSLAVNSSNRRALKEELEIAKTIAQIYPAEDSFQAAMRERVWIRLDRISDWSFFVVVAPYLGLSAPVWVVYFGLNVLRYASDLSGQNRIYLNVFTAVFGFLAVTMVLFGLVMGVRAKKGPKPIPREDSPDGDKPDLQA
jgi:hypothetical protein